jgi:hypothetical protein
MTATDVTASKERPAHLFKPGASGNPAGRPPGARSKFSEAFIQDLASIWEARGIEVLQECATKEPGTFLKVCASLMPRDVRLDVTLDAAGFVDRFRNAIKMLGNTPPARLPRPRVINND